MEIAVATLFIKIIHINWYHSCRQHKWGRRIMMSFFMVRAMPEMQLGASIISLIHQGRQQAYSANLPVFTRRMNLP